MTQTTEKTAKLIHIAQTIGSNGRPRLLLLRHTGDLVFSWHEEMSDGTEKETGLSASTIEEALRLAARHWRDESYRTIICGFRYTLPERDEHGINALFHQMVSSYSSMNGVYYDDELGNNCFVQSASSQAREIWQRLKNQKRL